MIAQLDNSLTSLLDEGLVEAKLTLSKPAREKLLAYVALLVKWNQVYNLTAVREPEKMISVHLLDSLVVAPYLSQLSQQGHPVKTLIDVGTGAGLPGIPLAIAEPDISITMLDCIQKKTTFVQQAAAELNLANARVVCARVEQHQPAQPFEGVISRAYAELVDFVAQAAHLCAEEGRLFAMKGIYPEDEIKRLAVQHPTWQVEQVHELHVPFLESKRHLIILKRTI